VHTASEDVVRGVIGQTVQLPCFYKVARLKDISDMCWGKGPCPNSKCNDKILHTTGNRVTFRKSQRYNLQGYISYGDVSLTIARVKAEDAGTYCCRVEIPGWFNDIKKNIRLEVVRAPPVMRTTTRKPPVSTNHFRKTTFAPQTTSNHETTAETILLATTNLETTTATTDHQTTAQTTVLLTTAIPETAATTTKSPAVITLETIAPSTVALTANDTVSETMVAVNGPPDFSIGFQAADMRAEEYDVVYPSESLSLPGATRATYSCVSRSEANMLLKPFQFFSSPFQIPSYAILTACLIAVSILFILMISLLFWKCKQTKKFIMKSLEPAENPEKVFSGAEGENSVFAL
ncbi:TIMD4 protein, partial [Bucco capensis]|nr:TIMD4 protein [Bucco capensis]